MKVRVSGDRYEDICVFLEDINDEIINVIVCVKMLSIANWSATLLTNINED